MAAYSIQLQGLGTASHQEYQISPSSSQGSSSSSVFDASSQISNSSASTSSSIPIAWEPEWSSRMRQPAPAPADQNEFAPIFRANTFPFSNASKAHAAISERALPPLRTDLAVPAEQRQHPRRSSTTLTQRPPQLVRQCERKVTFVDCLVDSATQMVEVIWPLSVPSVRCEAPSGRGVLPLRVFIQETLRRSRTSYSTLQVALYYLILIKPHVPKHDFTMEQPEDVQSLRALQCGRRMFLAALILASKYLQDRNYSAQAWSKISGLKVCEINTNEMAFLAAVNWKLHITDPIWERWQEIVLRHTPSNSSPPSPGAGTHTWRAIIPFLNAELSIVDQFGPRTPISPIAPEIKTEFINCPTPSPLPELSSSPESFAQKQYKAPRYLEPKPDLLPPTPPLVRLGPLPTPVLTPNVMSANTPAASAMTFGSMRSSMCTAMAQAQCSSLARSCVDQFNPTVRNGLEAYHFPSRRPSLAPSTTSTSSSPESMIMDNSSRSSRASSISSVSSAGWAPHQARLARLATCRSARLPLPTLQKCKEVSEYASGEPMSSPDLESFHIYEMESPVAATTTPRTLQGRKRGISSVDNLQQTVRQLLQSSQARTQVRGETMILPDRSVAASLSTSTSIIAPKGVQSPKGTVSESRFPVPRDLGRKRTCCGTKNAPSLRRAGPGMWEHVL